MSAYAFPSAMREPHPSNPAPRPLHDPAATELERQYALFNHLVGLSTLLGTSILGLVGTLIMWRIKCRESPFLDDHGREAVNFQLSLIALAVLGVVAGIIFSVVTLGFGAVIVGPLAPLGVAALMVLNAVGTIRGAIAANRGEYYRYPMCYRFIKEPGDRAV